VTGVKCPADESAGSGEYTDCSQRVQEIPSRDAAPGGDQGGQAVTVRALLRLSYPSPFSTPPDV